MFSLATAPAKQSVEETISTLSGRLTSATLLEDRRAAILGLRSFAKDYPASVASEALRSLIGSLSQDGEDVDTVKVVLETLLMLFSPNEDSPEASDEIALWLADEFTQRQDNITLLLDFLDTNEFYSRLYSLKLLVAILSARTQRTEECIFIAPLGISRLVAILEDSREAVRNEAITLLTFLTPTSLDIQKLVAFESAFDRTFAIIESDGALSEGGRAVEDCLIFLANLLRRNSSNQNLFRESGCIQKLADLLGRFLTDQSEETQLAEWAQGQRNRNVYAFLAVIRLFLQPGSKGTHQNQTAFWKHGLANNILQLAFTRNVEIPIKAEALITCGDIIQGNSFIQENFAQLMVLQPLGDIPPSFAEGHQKANGHANKVYVIDGLLDLTLNLPELSSFDIRFAACECLKSYFSGHNDVRLHFLGRAVDGYQAGHTETSNVLNVLLHPSDDSAASDPYRYWFAAVIAFHLLYDNVPAKAKILAVTEGDAENGEEVVSSVQTIIAHLLTSLRKNDDARIIIGYLMLLLGWLFEDLDAVNDFLSEGSNIQGLIQTVGQQAAGSEIVQGLCAMLLVLVYEFSTKDSPIPRTTVHSILLSQFDRDCYLDRLTKLRAHPAVRDFEVTPQKIDLSSGMLPDVFFDGTFINFFKDNYGRVLRAIDREPGMEISVVTNGVQKGVSRELVDTLREQLEVKRKALDDAQAALTSMEQRLEREQADHRRSKDGISAEASRAKNVQEGLQRSHEAELRKLESQQAAKVAEHEREVKRLHAQAVGKQDEHEKALKRIQDQSILKKGEYEKELKRLQALAISKAQEHQSEIEQTKKAAGHEAERALRRTEASIADLKATISRLEVDLIKANKSKTQALESAKVDYTKALSEEKAKMAELQKTIDDASNTTRKLEHDKAQSEKRSQELEVQNEELEKQLQTAQRATDEKHIEAVKAETELQQVKKAKDQTQAELDDLLIVFGDLEEKSAKYKIRLRELNETVSDVEEEDDEDDSGVEKEEEEDNEDDVD